MASRISKVAQFAGVSEATVRRVINGHGRPTPASMAAVLTALDVFGYERPDALGGQRNGLVGLVLPDLRNPTFPTFAEEISVALLRSGLAAALCTRTSEGLSEADYIEMLLAHATAGIIFVGSSFADAGARQGRALRRRRIPTVLINPADDNPGRARVSVDDALAVRMALDHLAALGHTRIGLVCGPVGHVPSGRKLRAFRDHCRGTPRLRGSDALVASTIFSPEGGEAATLRLLTRGVTAVVCGSDQLAIGAMRAARRRGLRVPDGLSVVGFDDSRFMTETNPPLTTLRQPVVPMAEAAVEALLRQIGGGDPPGDEEIFDPELIVRGSTARPAARA
ncbi:MAG TPA: LacI family DNA-binding transcriptional regulator [Rugosimonospora sp.]|nr:LacI family DNA-binding transcriptional regulator [Rugosimonospora sp.]